MARLSTRREKWFPIPGDKDNARVLIRALTRGEQSIIERDTTKVAFDFSSSGDGKVETTPLERLHRLREKCIVGWDGFYDEKNNPLKFNAANVSRFLYVDPLVGDPEKPFTTWLDEFYSELTGDDKDKEELEKNSVSGGGSTPKQTEQTVPSAKKPI